MAALWGSRTADCQRRFGWFDQAVDAHQMKVWALVVKGDDSALDQPFRALNVLKELME